MTGDSSEEDVGFSRPFAVGLGRAAVIAEALVDRGPQVTSGGRLRLARQARGLSQQQLAGMAGVTRQAVSAVESGQSDPSLRVALTLAQVLGMTVEELFRPEGAVPAFPAQMVPPDGGSGKRVTLARVGDSVVALPLWRRSASRAGFLPAGGLVAGPGREDAGGSGRELSVVPMEPLRSTLVVAGCDPALPLLEVPLGLLDPPVAFSWWPCTSQEALRLAARGLVHAAAAQLRGPSGEYNTTLAAELLPRGGEVIGFCAWREGLVLGPESAEGITGMADVVRRGLRLVNREPDAEARRVLDRELARLGIDGDHVPGYRTRAAGHLQVAEAIAAGLADAGVASEPAALAHGLPFIPLVAQRSDLVIPAGQARSREVKAMLKVLSSRWLLDRLASLPGYDPGPCGQHVATLLPAAGTGIGALRRSTVAPPAALHGRRDRCRRRTEPAGGTGSDAGGPCGWSPVLWSQVWWATCAAGRPGVDLQ